MTDRIGVALFQGSSARIITLEALAALSDAERAATEASPAWSTVSLVAGGEERWGHRLSLGPLEAVAAQLPQAADRLASGEPALVRSGVFDTEQAVLLVFEPDGDTTTALLAVLTEEPAASWMPHERQGPDLYEYVAAHRDALVGEVPPHTLLTADVVDALRRDYRLASEVL